MNKRISIALVLVFILNLMVMGPVAGAGTGTDFYSTISHPVKIEAPAELTVRVGETIPLTATLYFTDGKTIDAARNGVYSFGKVISFNNGLITGKKVGATTLRIKSYGQTANVRVTVIKAGDNDNTKQTPQTNQAKPIRIEAPKQIMLAVGEQVPLTATVYFSDGTTADVSKEGATYSYNNVITLQDGVITAQNIGSTTLKIKAYGKTASIIVKVTKTGKETLRIEAPKNLIVGVGGTATFTATAIFTDGSSADITGDAQITSLNSNVASVGNGMINGIKPGNATIKITYDGKTASIKVKVTKTGKEIVSIEAPRTLTVGVGENVTFTALAHFSDGSSADIIDDAQITVSNAKIASVNNKGVVTGINAGNTALKVSYDGKTVSVTIKVTKTNISNNVKKNTGNDNQTEQKPQVVPVRIETTNQITLAVGDQVPLTAKVYYSDSSSEDAIKDALYLVDNKEIVSVTQGVITGKKAGTTSFKIKSHGITNTIQVEVIQKEQEQQNSTNQTVAPVTLSGTKVTKNFSWQYNGINYSWEVDVPQDLLSYNNSIRESVKKYYSFTSYSAQQAYYQNLPQNVKDMIWSIGPKGNGNETSWVQDTLNLNYIKNLADKLQAQAAKNGWGKYDTANFVLKFVQSLPKEVSSYPQLAADSLILPGDCDTKSILYCDIMKKMGYQMALMHYKTGITSPTIAHMQAAVVLEDSDIPSDAFASYRIFNGQNYYEVETMNDAFNIGTSAGYKPTAIYPL